MLSLFNISIWVIYLNAQHSFNNGSHARRTTHELFVVCRILSYSPTSIKRPPSGLAKVRRLMDVGRLIEVQYKLDRKGSKHDFIARI